MRAILLMVAALMAGCASQRLAELPPAGVDLSGKWRLNVADSDDPMRIGQAVSGGSGSVGDGGGQRGGGRRGRGGQTGQTQSSASADPSAGVGAPQALSALSEVLSWPGRDLEIKQVAGVAAFTSNGDNRIYQPGQAGKKKSKHGARQVCGWSDSIRETMVRESGKNRSRKTELPALGLQVRPD